MLMSYIELNGWFAPIIVLIAIGVSMVLSQLIKYLINPYSLKTFSRDGGMPSTHATIIGSSLTGIFLVEGISMVFVLACAVGVIILRDAFGVRYAVGENAKVLKESVHGSLERRVIIDEGHKPIQLLVGFFLGVAVSCLFVFIFGISIF
ncbi:MAG: divergent PAP2 family protein [Nanobdellota archaeon]